MLLSDTNSGGTAASTDLLVKNINREKYRAVVCGLRSIGKQIERNADEFRKYWTSRN